MKDDFWGGFTLGYLVGAAAMMAATLILQGLFGLR